MPRRDALRNGETARKFALGISRERSFPGLDGHAVKQDGRKVFARPKALNRKGHVNLPEIFKGVLRCAHLFRAGAGGRDGLPMLRMIRRINDLIEGSRHRACPVADLFRPAVNSRSKRGLGGQDGERLIGIDLHLARAERLIQQDGNAECPGCGLCDVAGKPVGLCFDGEGQKTVDHGGRLRNALVTHGIIQQGIDKQAHPGPGLAGGGVRLKPLAGNLRKRVVKAAGHGFQVREGIDALAVIDHLAPLLAAPGLHDAGHSQKG